MPGYSVVWQDENGNELGRFDDPGFHPALLPPEDKPPTTAILRFIDPYGDTVLNQAQLDQLLSELESRRTEIADLGVRHALDKLLQFLRPCSHQVHTYVKVIGD